MFFWSFLDQNWRQKRVFRRKSAKIFNWAHIPDAIKLHTYRLTLKMFKNNVFHQKHLTNTLLTSPKWLWDYHFSSRYGQKRFFGAHKWPSPKYGYLGPDHQKMRNIKINGFHQKGLTHMLPSSPQWLPDDHFWPTYGQKGVFDVDPYVALLIVTPIGVTLRPLKISGSFRPNNWRKSFFFESLINFWKKRENDQKCVSELVLY